ncbi:type II toxin-antitoxin system VapB family antitoxin [Pseudomonas aeruginosa]|uniref:type II toxin-antitoxin system VapB family antitoxin n=1 Tax=Pseudomonas aeruginosa TaxID=287 RepID=UPI0022EBB8A3|nr:type II toxin-antitoxin system VapB family antitoxin [Pseudomonas aeruginosa]
MRITVTIDDELYKKALEMAGFGIDEKEIFSEALRIYIQVQAKKQLSATGGVAPDIQDVPRRR